ncbi:extracellular catalytic domain type 2 short-chain-length polyhydroxyalkanoate depolymerase [Pseudoduganella namucuonensis]|uniref:Esterase PHB depolymerase n=1 Tax=Pseudoduganella namucuonensis TaxID=1035707 RepID=A0A1I7G9P8_9BURK|nr:PHB depolymerase family esterase [Pseudoduganella namucuonensis]SFU45148.1 Esterase PHB depolymerase [Pseudoduganella namucuonensis]
MPQPGRLYRIRRHYHARLYHVLTLCGLIALASVLLPASAQTTPASLPAMRAADVSVSGLASGGDMAVQFDIAYSATVKGAGVIAGAPYDCARGRAERAATVCGCAGPAPCRVQPGGTNVQELAAATERYAEQGAIDPTANLAAHRIWLFSGSADTLVPEPVVNDLRHYYARYTEAIVYRNDIAAQHAMPTDGYGPPCAVLAPPYLNNCAFDAAGELLDWIYGGLDMKSAAPPAGRFIAFDQARFLRQPARHGMAATGYLYLPPDCEASRGEGCRLHVAFHGCGQNARAIGDKFIRNAGYNAWADTNRIMVLYPQAAPRQAGASACGDWQNFGDPRHARKNGRQMAAVKAMVDRLTGGARPAAAPASGS